VQHKSKFILFIVSFFYVGLISKKIPGTLGSFAATIIAITLPKSTLLLFYISLALFVVGTKCSDVHITKYQCESDKDPGYIVIDEACGIFFGCAILFFASLTTTFDIVVNFLLFRLFDILKPFPIRNVEKYCKLHPKTVGFGIMIDDIMAAVIASVLQIIIS
jgi:phosphatidylglycerophosphatase A